MEMIYGYVRVSTREQNEERQMLAMDQFGIARNRVYVDKQSGKDFLRPQYQKMIKVLRKGDTVVIKSIDRLGRNYVDIIEQWRMITKEKKASIIVLDMPLLNTSIDRDLTGQLIADIVLQLLSYVAQTEREFIRQRQAEGIAAAKARGVRFGVPPMPRPASYPEIYQFWLKGLTSARGAGRMMHISHKTFLKWTRMDREENRVENKGI